jgi:predicted O-methyltransferase YrrM
VFDSTRARPQPARVQDIELNWFNLMQSVLDAKNADFMALMQERKRSLGSKSSMGKMDCALLYALIRAFRPRICVETGANTGMASSFILKALHDAEVPDAKLYGIEYNTECAIGSMIPENLRGPFVPCPGNVKGFMKKHLGPAEIDFFLHDSMHRYKHQYGEFKHFWKRLRSGGLLVSHDVNMNAAFTDFISKTYVHDFKGFSVADKTQHAFWARWGNLGFIVKA